MFLIAEEVKEQFHIFHKELLTNCDCLFLWYQNKMTQYNALKVKLSNSQLNILKSGRQNGSDMTLKLSSSVLGDCKDGNNFPHKFFTKNF